MGAFTNNTMEQHLLKRDLLWYRYNSVVVDKDEVTFLLHNLSGKCVGYQVYNPSYSKDKEYTTPREQRYFSHVTKGELGVWGLESYNSYTEPLYIVEGVFDACKLHNLGLQCAAVLCCNPEHMKHWLFSLPNDIFAICEGDAAGRMMAKYGKKAIYLPAGKDCGDLTNEELKELLWN